ncbi:MAG TPA: SDR family NAD(P)-dependent oxidoreductase [Chitinophagaceae bacterium]|nr:SDR family NAD(P)-dependent oxidoreductase [Chitinophagaceae bacterium]
MQFNEHVVWITGASSGLGKYMALEFAKQGAVLALSARRTDLLDELATSINAAGGRASSFYCDVAEEMSIKSCVSAIISSFGRIDVAIANAGFGVVGKIEKLEASEWNRQLQVNVTGLALTCKHAIPYLKQCRGRLVLIGSVSAYIPSPGVGAYGASKAAVHNIGETLQLELKNTGVSCTTIHPGFVDSNISRVDNEGVFHEGREDPRPAKLMWPTEKAATLMVRAIANRRRVYVFTGHGKIIAFLGRHFPALVRYLIGKAPIAG